MKKIEDVQARRDQRNIAISRVGIKDISHPVLIENEHGIRQHNVAQFSMSVNLSAEQKGTHMSRFVALLNENEIVLSPTNFAQLLEATTQKLEAEHAYLEVACSYFKNKSAPVSKIESLMDYQIQLIGKKEYGHAHTMLEVTIPVKSLCPCSKKISEYGAHNQRSHITVGVDASKKVWIDTIIDSVEQQASAQLYALLKREDEKYITEYAYNNPKFVEDVVRDVATVLEKNPHIHYFYVHAENFESIHNHSAFALVESDTMR